MIRTAISSLATLLLAGSAIAQCTDNLYPITLTDAAGVPAPLVIDPISNETVADFASEAVYMAFDPNLPSGTYYVHVTDPINGPDMVLSTNDPLDRFVQIVNTNGVITLSLPMSSNTPVTGLGLGGVGQSLLLQPFTNNPNEPCRFKAWLGDNWNLANGPANPWLLRGGLNQSTGLCSVRSYRGFRIGDGTGTDIEGGVFLDANRNGIRDTGENGLPGWEVSLVNTLSTVPALTDASGRFEFTDVTCDNYTIELTLQAGFVPTTPTSLQLEVCGCADIIADDFGVVPELLASDGHTIGFWRNRHGLCLVHQHNILSLLPALGIVDGAGQRVVPATLEQYRRWLRRARARNMAYMLSAQLVAMHNNVLVGFVDPSSVIDDPHLGQLTIADLMQQATMSLWAHPFTPRHSPHRAEQARLKNALDDANNNRNWM